MIVECLIQLDDQKIVVWSLVLLEAELAMGCLNWIALESY